jgi:hypothetical protein
MERYLIETPHTKEECLALLKEVKAQGYLRHFDWGCGSRVHTGWAIIEAEDDAQASLAIPPLVRSKARVVKLSKYDAASIESFERQVAEAEGN